MRKNLAVSAVSAIFGVFLIGGIILSQPPEHDQLGAIQIADTKDTNQEILFNPYNNMIETSKELFQLGTSWSVTVSLDFVSYSCNEDLNDILNSYIHRLPQEILDAIQSKGYRMELVENPAETIGKKGKWSGVTLPDEKRILIQADESKFRRSVVHELGHAFDDYLNWISLSTDFTEIYELEKDSFEVTGFITEGHYKLNVKEYFAEAFQMYVYDADTLQRSAPQTHEFIENCIEEVTLLILYPSDFALLEGYSSADEVINYYRAVQHLPKDMFDRLVYQDWKLVYIDNINEVYPHAIGYYNTELKEVYVDDEKIKNCYSDADNQIQETIVHEFIHAYDYEQDYPSSMIYNPSGLDSDEVFAYNMTDWLFGKSVSLKYQVFFENLFR